MFQQQGKTTAVEQVGAIMGEHPTRHIFKRRAFLGNRLHWYWQPNSRQPREKT